MNEKHDAPESPMDQKEFARNRELLIKTLQAEGIRDQRVLAAMKAVPRHLFVPKSVRGMVYEDRSLSIGYGQTISQPFIVAFMTEALKLKPGDRVLEVGTGSGYQAAVLGKLAREVYSIEIIKPLAQSAAKTLSELGYSDVRVKEGNGYLGWPDKAPFDCIIITAAPNEIPSALTCQLADNGRMIVPVGSVERDDQKLLRIIRHGKTLEREELLPVRFVPMTGKPK